MMNEAFEFRTEIPESYLTKWQSSIDVLAKAFEVPAALIMRMHEDSLEVLIRNQSSDCPYQVNEKVKRFSNLYCDTVIARGDMLEVAFAPEDPEWCNNPDTALNMNSYLGIPVRWHNSTSIFGTLCVLDKDRREYSQLYKNIMLEFQKIIEQDLQIIAHEQVMEQQLLQLKEANRNLIAAKEREQAAHQSKSNFLAFMSHEIRTSLNGILGTAHLMQDSELDKQQQQYLNIINASSDTLLTLLNDILDYSKIEAGQFSLHEQAFNLDALIAELIETYQNQDISKTIMLEFLTNNLEQELWFIGDNIRIRQILSNIISNAVKFTEQGKVTVKRSFTDNNNIRISVSDTGIGISQKDQEELFSEYTQFQPGQNINQAGTGLGLSICKKLIELMGGQIGVISEKGQGSCFWIEIPLTQIKADKEQKAETQQTLDQASSAIKILVAEDNEINQLVLKGFLKKLGQEAVYTADGEQALACYCQHAEQGSPFELILMDCEMPIMDGISASQAIRRHEQEHGVKRSNIVALSAHAMGEFGQNCLDAGMDRHISKPLQLSSLKEIIWLVSKQNSPVL